jgi:hypothetical protein
MTTRPAPVFNAGGTDNAGPNTRRGSQPPAQHPGRAPATGVPNPQPAWPGHYTALPAQRRSGVLWLVRSWRQRAALFSCRFRNCSADRNLSTSEFARFHSKWRTQFSTFVADPRTVRSSEKSSRGCAAAECSRRARLRESFRHVTIVSQNRPDVRGRKLLHALQVASVWTPTPAPSAPKWITVQRPIPELAPVTRATLPANRDIAVLSSRSFHWLRPQPSGSDWAGVQDAG